MYVWHRCMPRVAVIPGDDGVECIEALAVGGLGGL